MSFGYSRNSGISWFRDYGDAFHKYQSTTDIRGRVEEPKRPLGQRKSVDSYSIRLKDDGSMGVECVLYKTPVVTFYPTGLVELRCNGWVSASTACFIEEVANFNARIFNGSLCVSIGGVETRMSDDQVLQIKDGRMLNPTKDTTHSLIRGKSNKVRKQYDEFLTYASALVRLKSEGFLIAEYQDNFSKAETNSAKNYIDMPEALNRPNYTHFADDVRMLFKLVNSDGEDKHVAHYKAVLALAHSFGRNTWGQGYKLTGCHINEQMLRKAFDGLVIGYHRDELFVEKEREEGQVKKDPYKKYFESGWLRLHQKT